MTQQLRTKRQAAIWNMAVLDGCQTWLKPREVYWRRPNDIATPVLTDVALACKLLMAGM